MLLAVHATAFRDLLMEELHAPIAAFLDDLLTVCHCLLHRDLLMEELRASIAASAEELASGAAAPATFEVKVQHVRQVNATQVCTFAGPDACILASLKPFLLYFNHSCFT